MHPTFTSENVCIYQIPPLKSIKAGRRAKEWNVDEPLWKGKLCVEEDTLDSGKLVCNIRLYEKDSGELFAEAPYTPEGHGIEPVLDSSRYFAITVVDGGRRAVLGLGFIDRDESFDFNIALQNYRKHAAPISVKTEYSWDSEGHGKQENMQENKDDTQGTQGVIPLLPPPISRAQAKQSGRESPFDDDFGDDFGDFQG